MKKLCLVLILALLLASVVPAFAGASSLSGQVDFSAPAPEGYKLIASNTPVYAIQFWHYSGGYWANKRNVCI